MVQEVFTGAKIIALIIIIGAGQKYRAPYFVVVTQHCFLVKTVLIDESVTDITYSYRIKCLISYVM